MTKPYKLNHCFAVSYHRTKTEKTNENFFVTHEDDTTCLQHVISWVTHENIENKRKFDSMPNVYKEFVENQKNKLSYRVRGAVYEVHKVLGMGLYEECYQQALLHELDLRGIKAEGKVKLPVIYKGVEIKDAYEIDILVEDKLILELKSVESLCRDHYKQILNYLHLTDLYEGFLINFNTPYLDKDNFKRVYNPHATIQEDI